MQLDTANIFDLPYEVLVKIFKTAENNKNVSETCVRFYEIINTIKEKKILLRVINDNLINPTYELDKWLEDSQISLFVKPGYYGDLDEKLKYFLQFYGHQVTNFILREEINNFATQLIQLMPNLKEVEIFFLFPTEGIQVEKHSIKLKKLKVDPGITAACIEMFIYEELEINTDFFSWAQNFIGVLENYKNVKKLTLKNINLTENLTEVMNQLDLEILNVHNVEVDQKMFANCLKNQRKLKKFAFEAHETGMESELWNVMCDNLQILEKLTVKIDKRLTGQNFSRISKLKTLKSLNISGGLNHECFCELSRLEFTNLISIGLDIKLKLTCENVQNFAQKFADIKSLSFNFFRSKSIEILLEILKTFNKIEDLSLEFTNSKIISNQSHPNTNLKSLHLGPSMFRLKKLIPKFIRDFPNLEVLKLSGEFKSATLLEWILIGFKNLKVFKIDDHRVYDSNFYATFMKYGQNLDEIPIDINSIENPNELVTQPNIIIKFIAYKSVNVFNTKNKLRQIDLQFLTYSNWKTFRTAVDSEKPVSDLFIYQSLDYLNSANPNFEIDLMYLKAIGESVKTLFIDFMHGISVFKKIFEAVPNLEKLTLRHPSFDSEDEVYHINNKALTSLHLSYSGQDDPFDEREFDEFDKFIKIPDNSLKRFEFTTTQYSGYKNESLERKLDKLLENQPQLTKKCHEYERFLFTFRYLTD